MSKAIVNIGKTIYFGIPKLYFQFAERADLLGGFKLGGFKQKCLSFAVVVLAWTGVFLVEWAITWATYGLSFANKLPWIYVLVLARQHFTLPVDQAKFVGALFTFWLSSLFVLIVIVAVYEVWQRSEICKLMREMYRNRPRNSN